MAITVEADPQVRSAARSMRVGRRSVRVVGPDLRDPRMHLAATTVAILIVGLVWLDFRLSIPQIVLPVVACAALDVARTYRRSGVVAWPASAMQTATSTVVILRITGFESGHWWSFTGWYYYVGIAVAGIVGKYVIRRDGRHVFNPSNLPLVVAFLVFGADRIEPLDLWWGPLGWDIAAAYAVILIGGITLCRRLRLLELAVAFYVTFAVGVGVLALLGHSITAQWSLAAVSGLHLWWIFVTSPEILVFVFFMITDPRTAPTDRSARVAFGVGVGVCSTILLAPWPTEFGAKVGVLAGLLTVTAIRPVLEWSSARSPELRAVTGDWPREHRFVAGALGCVVFVGATMLASTLHRPAEARPVAVPDVPVGDLELPPVTIDADVAGLSAELATPEGAGALARALAFDLGVEAEAMRTRDSSLLAAVDHGARLEAMTAAIDGAGAGDLVARRYHFETLHLSIVYPGGAQSGANAGLAATGTVTLISYGADGEALETSTEPVEVMFTLRSFGAGRWLITDGSDTGLDAAERS